MKLRTLIVVGFLSLIAIGASVGCASFSELFTPATIDRQAVSYVLEAGVAEPNEYSGWDNLEKAIRLEADVDAAFEVKALAIKQMEEKNQLDYSQLSGVVSKHLEQARAREAAIFGPEGLLTLGLGMAGFGGFTGLVGLMRKRPGDMTPDDLRNAVDPIKDQIGIKEEQFAQVVTGVEKFIQHKDEINALMAEDTDTAQKTDAVLKLLKTYLGRAQDTKTQQEVAKIKVNV